MKKIAFPYIALVLGFVLMLVVVKGSEFDSQGATTIPLLTLLAINEFALIVTAIGGFLEIRKMLTTGVKLFGVLTAVLCLLLSIRFLFIGIDLWPL
ncbi:MAG: hypothetical protein OEX19_17705 [Gammaproteobacteria bacterium]|nr:hypothetical protein [Gammaproteobacteria bacterium]